MKKLKDYPLPEVICENGKMEFTDNKFQLSYFIEIKRIADCYGTETLWTSKLIDVGELKKPVFSVKNPYDFPVIIQLNDYYDTYYGVIAERASEKEGWYTLDSSSKIDYETRDSIDEDMSKRNNLIAISDDNVDALRLILNWHEQKCIPEKEKLENAFKKLKSIVLKIDVAKDFFKKEV